MRVAGSGPSGAAGLQPGAEQAGGQVVQGAGPAAQEQAAAARVGIGEAQKLTVIFIGCFFQLTLMVTMIVSGTRRDLVEAAYTLGCTDIGVVRRVLLPGAAPEIAEALRQVLGLGWTYIIVAELIGASSGIGHMITDSQALMATDHIIAGIVTIGLVGLASDLLFKKANQLLFAWSFLR